MPLWVFLRWNIANYCRISNQRPRICLVAEFCAKIKVLKIGTKNLGILGSNFVKPLSYLKSGPSNLSHSKVWCKKENPGSNMEFENNIVIF